MTRTKGAIAIAWLGIVADRLTVVRKKNVGSGARRETVHIDNISETIALQASNKEHLAETVLLVSLVYMLSVSTQPYLLTETYA